MRDEREVERKGKKGKKGKEGARRALAVEGILRRGAFPVCWVSRSERERGYEREPAREESVGGPQKVRGVGSCVCARVGASGGGERGEGHRVGCAVECAALFVVDDRERVDGLRPLPPHNEPSSALFLDVRGTVGRVAGNRKTEDALCDSSRCHHPRSLTHWLA